MRNKGQIEDIDHAHASAETTVLTMFLDLIDSYVNEEFLDEKDEIDVEQNEPLAFNSYQKSLTDKGPPGGINMDGNHPEKRNEVDENEEFNNYQIDKNYYDRNNNEGNSNENNKDSVEKRNLSRTCELWMRRVTEFRRMPSGIEGMNRRRTSIPEQS
ncbi:11572_t:CDS:2 [Dentiscutata heterogama]|uniref:11572_t:CDS:1 n=1 Tax=Dentiscutata heterogama TaxID=1316150 RepID=A0ACA9MKX4_9GLOM|nr:11572_t:CDS:2 [Dentiscutata heterogama]